MVFDKITIAEFLTKLLYGYHINKTLYHSLSNKLVCFEN